MPNHLAVIGTYRNEALKLRDKPKKRRVVCYQPTMYLNLQNRVKSMSSVKDLHAVFSAKKKRSLKGVILPELEIVR